MFGLFWYKINMAGVKSGSFDWYNVIVTQRDSLLIYKQDLRGQIDAEHALGDQWGDIMKVTLPKESVSQWLRKEKAVRFTTNLNNVIFDKLT